MAAAAGAVDVQYRTVGRDKGTLETKVTVRRAKVRPPATSLGSFVSHAFRTRRTFLGSEEEEKEEEEEEEEDNTSGQGRKREGLDGESVEEEEDEPTRKERRERQQLLEKLRHETEKQKRENEMNLYSSNLLKAVGIDHATSSGSKAPVIRYTDKRASEYARNCYGCDVSVFELLSVTNTAHLPKTAHPKTHRRSHRLKTFKSQSHTACQMHPCSSIVHSNGSTYTNTPLAYSHSGGDVGVTKPELKPTVTNPSGVFLSPSFATLAERGVLANKESPAPASISSPTNSTHTVTHPTTPLSFPAAVLPAVASPTHHPRSPALSSHHGSGAHAMVPPLLCLVRT